MQSLIVVLALFVGAVFADTPLDYYKKYGDRMRSSSRIGSSENQHLLTSSEYLKRAMAHDSGMVDAVLPNAKMTERAMAQHAAESLMAMLPRYGLFEAYDIARRINLQQIMEDSNYASFTMFVPNDDAIRDWRQKVSAELAENDEVLTSLARAWVVPNLVVRYQDVFNELQLPTLATDVKLRMNVYTYSTISWKVMTVNGANIVRGNYKDDNFNIVHIIDKMIFPLPDGNVVDTLAKVDEFSVLFDLVKKAGLQESLAAYNGLTLLAPVNSAFDLVPSDIMADLKTNKTKLQRLLNYHVIPKTYYTTGMMVDGRFDNRAGETMAAEFEKDQFHISARLEQSKDQTSKAEILYQDIPATNGVIQVIDKVLSIKCSQ